MAFETVAASNACRNCSSRGMIAASSFASSAAVLIWTSVPVTELVPEKTLLATSAKQVVLESYSVITIEPNELLTLA